MKIYNIAIVLAAAVSILGGCSREENHDPSTPVPLMVSVGVDRIESSKGNVVTGNAFTKEQRINVILVDETPANATPQYPAMAPYVCAITGTAPDLVTTWSPVEPAKTPIVVANRAAVLAHYPDVLPNASKLSADKRTLEIDIPAEIPYGEMGEWNFNAVAIDIAGVSTEVWFAKGDEDYMTGYGGTVSAVPTTPGDPSTAENKTAIAMKHALAMVVVQITMEASNPDRDKTIDGLWVANANPTTGPLQVGSVNLADNAFTPNGTRIEYSRPMANFATTGNYFFGLLAYPATIAAQGDVQIICSAGAARYTYNVPAVAWEAGKVYLYTLRLTPASGMLSDDVRVRVVDWPETTDVQMVVD